MIRLLNDGTWSRPPFITGARQAVLRHLDGATPAAPLGDLAEFVNGTSYDKAKLVETDGMPIIRISNVSDPTAPHLQTTESFADKFMVEPGDLLVSWSASFKSLVWPGPLAVLNQHIFRVREQEGVDKAYLRHAIEASLDKMLESAVGMGMKHLRRADFLGHEVPLPPLPVQQALGAFLDAAETSADRPSLPAALGGLASELDALERTLSAADAALRRVVTAEADLGVLRQRVLDDAVRGRLTERDPADEPAEALLMRIAEEKRRRYEAGEIRKSKTLPPVEEDEQPFELPEGWVWTRVGNIGYVQLGRQRSPANHNGPHMRPYLRVANVYEAEIDTSDVKEMNFDPSDFEQYRLVPGDILINEGQSAELVGRPAIYDGEVPGACFQNTLVRVQPYHPIGSAYPLAVFRAYMHDGTFTAASKQTTNIAHLGATRLSKLPFPLPPVGEQRRIVERVDALLPLCDRLAERLTAARADAERLTQTVLADALSA